MQSQGKQGKAGEDLIKFKALGTQDTYIIKEEKSGTVIRDAQLIVQHITLIDAILLILLLLLILLASTYLHQQPHFLRHHFFLTHFVRLGVLHRQKTLH